MPTASRSGIDCFVRLAFSCQPILDPLSRFLRVFLCDLLDVCVLFISQLGNYGKRDFSRRNVDTM